MILNVSTLQDRLLRCESEITEIALCGDGHLAGNDSRLLRLLTVRCDTLNRLFEFHLTLDDIQHVEEKNNQLTEIERTTFEAHDNMYQRLCDIDLRFDLHTRLEYRRGDEIKPMEDDAFYGSRWADMIAVLSRKHHDLYACRTYPFDDRHTPYSDGWTWTGRLHGSPRFNHLKLCYTFWVLCERLNYSIPDVLRMNRFGYSHEASFDSEINE